MAPQWSGPSGAQPHSFPAEAPPPPRAHGRPRWPALAVVVAVVVAGVLVAIAATRSPSAEPPVTQTPPPPSTSSTPTPSPRTTSPAPTPTTPALSPSPSATVPVDPGPRAWQLPPRTWPELPSPEPRDEVWAALQRTKLNQLPPVDLSGCPEPATVRDEAQWKAAVRAQWHCVHTAWVPVLKQLRWDTVEPEIKFFPGRGSKSACGYLEAPAFYCSAGHGTVFFGGEHLTMAKEWDLSVNEMVNHEYGHHLQKLAGITAAKVEVTASADIERRAELQATCWAGTMTWHNRSFEFSQSHFDGWTKRLRTMLVDGVHGSRASIQYWGMRGLYATTMGDCNTWVVDSERVS